jgi:hypothetical protein
VSKMVNEKSFRKASFVFVFFLVLFFGSIDFSSAGSIECGSFSSGLTCSNPTNFIGSGYTQSSCLSACESNNAGCCQFIASAGGTCLYSSSSGTSGGSDDATNCVECTSSDVCDTYAGYYCDGSNWQTGTGTSYVCSTTNHCYSGTYYSNYVCNGAGSCSNHADPIEADSSTTACSCAGGDWLQEDSTSGSNYYCCGDDGSSDDFYTIAYDSHGIACNYCDNAVANGDFYYGDGHYSGSLTSDTTIDCYYGDPSCSSTGGADGSSTTLYGNGYLYDSINRCYYGSMSCGDGTYSDGSYETCEDSCVNDYNGGSCGNTHSPASSQTCYYNDDCTTSSCSYSSSATLRANYCDSCTSSGRSYGQYCPDPGTSSGSTCYYGTQYCSGTTCTMTKDTSYYDCIDAGDSDGSVCYTSDQTDDCTSSVGWRCSGTPSYNSSYASCLGDGDISGSYCYYGSQSNYCTTSGWDCNNGAYDSTKDTSCLENGDVYNGVCYYGDATDTCVDGSGWDCSSGASDSTLYSSYTESSCTYSNLDGSNDFCFYDGGDDCYYNSGTSCVDGSGWSFSYDYCEDPGYVSGSRCYYDSNGGGESNSCSSSGCVGIDYETTSVTCDIGSLSGGAMGCWDGSTCYYSSDGCDYYAGWDFSSQGTACSAGTSTCCTSSSTIYEGVGCSYTGATGTSYDRDSSQTRCESTASGCTSYDWLTGGESSTFGEYTTGSETECCGDDAGENRDVSTYNANMDGAADGTDACCSASTDCVDASVCYNTGLVTHDADADGDNDYCNAGTWQDCNTDAQCATGSGYHCVSSDCVNTCSVNADCPGGYYCNGGTCQATLADYNICDEDSDCTNGNCDAAYNSATKYCHATATSCVNAAHNGEIVNGNEQCSGPDNDYRSCSSGTWTGATDCDDSVQQSVGGDTNYCKSEAVDTCSSGASGGCVTGAISNINEGLICSNTNYCSGDGWYSAKTCSSGTCGADATFTACADTYCSSDGDGTYSSYSDSTCSGSSCTAQSPTSCALNICSGTVCSSSCATNNDALCIASAHCEVSTCVADKADGATCVDDTDCTSGKCDNDGLGLADDYHCYSTYSTYFDNQETTMCEVDTGAGTANCDERTGNACADISTETTSWTQSPVADEKCSSICSDSTCDATCCSTAAATATLENGEVCSGSKCTGTCSGANCLVQMNNGYLDCDANAVCLSGVCAQVSVTSATSNACDTSSGAICDGANDADMCTPSGSCVYDSNYDGTLVTGQYVASGSVAIDVDNDGDSDYCSSGAWLDCSTDAQCGTGLYCSGGNCAGCTAAQCATVPQCRDGSGGCCDADSDCGGDDYCDDGDNSARPYICETPSTATRGTTYIPGGLGSSGNDFAYITSSVSPTSDFCIRYDVRDTEDTGQFDFKVNQVVRVGSPVASGNDITLTNIVYDLGAWAAGTSVVEFEQVVNGHTYYNVLFGWWRSEAGAVDGGASNSCCDTSTDCVDDYLIDSTYGCYNTLTERNTGGGDGADLEQCRTGTWYAADADSTACAAVAGSTRWNIGGEVDGTTCCGDDASENRDVSAYNANMDGAADGTDACCTASTDCVDANGCYNTGLVTHDADADGDNDYCNAGTWNDCTADAQCATGSGYHCVSSDCVNTCSVNADCPGGYYCNGGTCQSTLADGVACDENSDCLNSNCRKEIDSASYFCAASGKECSNSAAAGYDTGQSLGTWLCTAQDASTQCTAGTICDTYVGNYCTGSTWVAGDGTSFECDGTNSCANQYQYYTGKVCNGGAGTAGACSSNSGLTGVTVGDVCSSGNSVNPSSAFTCGTGAQSCNCDERIDCVDNACSATRYLRGFSGAACTDAGRVSNGVWNAASGNSISGTTYDVGASCTEAADLCSTTDICSPFGSYYGDQTCDGAGSCNVGYGSVVEPDTLALSCECEVTGTQSTCTDTESDCWVSTNSECCGDDGTGDDWVTTGGACIDGIWNDGSECIVSADCGAGDYCVAGTYVCATLPTCAEANAGTGYNSQESNEDFQNDCSVSYDACTNQYTRSGPDGFCSGVGYSCKTTGATLAVTVGDVCQGGTSVNPSGATTCGTGAQNCYCQLAIDCNDNSCSAPKYYEGYSGAACTATGRVSYGTWYASSGNSVNGNVDGAGTTCSQGVDYCSTADVCWAVGSYYDYQTCDAGGGNCNQPYGATVEPDTSSGSCECDASGTQGTCDNAESGCWSATDSACCGDDGTADDWIGIGNVCYDGVWWAGADCLEDVDCGDGFYCNVAHVCSIKVGDNVACDRDLMCSDVDYTRACYDSYSNLCQGTSGSVSGQCRRDDGEGCTKGTDCGSGVCLGGTCRAASGANCGSATCGTQCSAGSELYTSGDGQFGGPVNSGCSSGMPIVAWAIDTTDCIGGTGDSSDPDCQTNCDAGLYFIQSSGVDPYVNGHCIGLKTFDTACCAPRGTSSGGDDGGDCSSGLDCNGAPGLCKKLDGQACSADADCISLRCDGTCQAKLADGGSCDEASDCINANCRKEIDSASEFCAAAGKECSNSGTAGYDTGQSLSSWLCTAQDASTQCSAGTICDTYVGSYCTGSTWVAGDGTAFTCSAANTCANQYQYYDGKTCNGGVGTGGACTVDSALTGVTVGDVCQAGNSVNPSSASTCGTGAQSCSCDTTIDCTTGACSVARYYRGFNGVSCTDTGRVSYSDYNAGDGTEVSETNYKTGTTCATSATLCSETDFCSVDTYYTGYTCNGAGACSSLTNVATIDSDYNSASCSCYSGVWTNGPISDPTGVETFLLKNTIGTECFKVETTGNFEVTGTKSYSQGTLTPPAGSFVLKDSAGNAVFYIDSLCNMKTKGTLNEKQGSVSYVDDNSFYLKRTDGVYVFKIGNNGNIYTIGKEGPYCTV